MPSLAFTGGYDSHWKKYQGQEVEYFPPPPVLQK
jgi:hypothetical protein